jgi:hypothetical protein
MSAVRFTPIAAGESREPSDDATPARDRRSGQSTADLDRARGLHADSRSRPIRANAVAGRLLDIHPSLLPATQGSAHHRRALEQRDDAQRGATVHYVTTPSIEPRTAAHASQAR